MVDTVAKHSNRGGGTVRGSPDRALEGAGVPSNRRASRTLAPAGDEPQPYRRSPWRRPNDGNQSISLGKITLPRNVKTNSFGQQRRFLTGSARHSGLAQHLGDGSEDIVLRIDLGLTIATGHRRQDVPFIHLSNRPRANSDVYCSLDRYTSSGPSSLPESVSSKTEEPSLTHVPNQ